MRSLFRIPSLLTSEESGRREQCLVAVGGEGEFCVMDSSGLVTVARADTDQRSR